MSPRRAMLLPMFYAPELRTTPSGYCFSKLKAKVHVNHRPRSPTRVAFARVMAVWGHIPGVWLHKRLGRHLQEQEHFSTSPRDLPEFIQLSCPGWASLSEFLFLGWGELLRERVAYLPRPVPCQLAKHGQS